ncbi:metallophosphoesterase MPPED2-like [Clavelina lepadiformis]|uniref:Calcineurin-like phosphoesterase domain-containing protein n=1 Tax=Clavelina lepadiformis TaxID=159417 RepID=A0ABP0GT28_CLALP
MQAIRKLLKMDHTTKFKKVDTISVDPLSEDPDEFIDQLVKSTQTRHRHQVKQISPLPLDTPMKEGHTRFVCISDTHGEHRKLESLPKGDVLLHCGDFTDLGKQKQVEDFNEWIGSFKDFKHKIIIGGNHELSFDPKIVAEVRRRALDRTFCWYEYINKIPPAITDDWPKVLSNCVYLQDAEVSVNGIRIYGCPWNPEFGGWGFNTKRGEDLLSKWNKIPGDGIDILMTHCPPAGFCDQVEHYQWEERVGCVDLMNTVQLRVQPKYHLFGHIHEAYGYVTDGQTNYINCSYVDRKRRPCNLPVIFDFPNPPDAPEGLSELIQY